MNRSQTHLVDRRTFLKVAGVGLGGLLVQPAPTASAAQGGEEDLAILYDASLCIACRRCMEACKEYNELPGEPTEADELSAITWNLVEKRPGFEREEDPFFVRQCMHCTEAACVAVCPTGALQYDELGFVGVDVELCNGCGYCTQFCPFGIPHLGDANVVTGVGKTGKCTFCQEKTRAGDGGPSCAEACPTGALTWGPRQDLVDRAQQKVSELEDEGRIGAQIYGLNELGGLHRLSILLDDPRAYGLPLRPEGTFDFSSVWQRAIQPLGGVAVGATAVGLVLNWLVARTQIKAEKQ